MVVQVIARTLARFIVPLILSVAICTTLSLPPVEVTFWTQAAIQLSVMTLCGLHAFIVDMTRSSSAWS